ncbi:MAG: hypothetical protein U9N54_07890 [candidate division Zixibacteria bacterium]|nr:hypothetical protein [candidate division Zixibacteria bacterium]
MITKELLIRLAKEQTPWATYIAMDETLKFFAHREKPKPNEGFWKADGHSKCVKLQIPNYIWQESLVEIPQDKQTYHGRLEPEWHDLTWARDRVFNGHKVCHFGQESESYFYVDKNEIYMSKSNDPIDYIKPNEFARGVKWKLHEEPKPEFIGGWQGEQDENVLD